MRPCAPCVSRVCPGSPAVLPVAFSRATRTNCIWHHTLGLPNNFFHPYRYGTAGDSRRLACLFFGTASGSLWFTLGLKYRKIPPQSHNENTISHVILSKSETTMERSMDRSMVVSPWLPEHRLCWFRRGLSCPRSSMEKVDAESHSPPRARFAR